MATENLFSQTRTRNGPTADRPRRSGADHPMWFLLPALAVLVVFFFNPTLFTLIYAVLVAIFQNLFGLILALVFERDTHINRFARVAFFVPVVMSALAVGYIFQAMLKPEGALNSILSFFTRQPVSIAWLGSTTWTIVVVALIHSWKWMGLSMLIYLAGLKTINEDLIDAARLDGASWWTTFREIRFPPVSYTHLTLPTNRE